MATIGPGDDLVLLLRACSVRLDDVVLERIRSSAGADIRYTDGYVFQHLVEGPTTVTQLARRLGVTQQAASKQVDGLLQRRLVVRRRDPGDGRAWHISLSARGQRAVEAARTAREAIAAELADELGAATVDRLVRALQTLATSTGAMEHLLSRRVRPEPQR